MPKLSELAEKQHLTLDHVLDILEKLGYPSQNITPRVNFAGFDEVDIDQTNLLQQAIVETIRPVKSGRAQLIIFRVNAQSRAFSASQNENNHFVAINIAQENGNFRVTYIDPTGQKISSEIESIISSQLENYTIRNLPTALQYTNPSEESGVYEMRGNDYDCGNLLALTADMLRRNYDGLESAKLDEESSKKLGSLLRKIINNENKLEDVDQEIGLILRENCDKIFDLKLLHHNLPNILPRDQSTHTQQTWLEPKLNDLKILITLIKKIEEIEKKQHLDAESFLDFFSQFSLEVSKIYRKDNDSGNVRNKYGLYNQATKSENADGIDFDCISSLATVLKISPEDVDALKLVLRSKQPVLLSELIFLKRKFYEILQKEQRSLKPLPDDSEKTNNHKKDLENEIVALQKTQDRRILTATPSAKNLYSILSFFRTKNFLNYVNKVLADKVLLENLNLFASDLYVRYTFARVITVVGEAFKKIPHFEQNKILQDLFGTISDLRDDIVHQHHSLIAKPKEFVLTKLKKIDLVQTIDQMRKFFLIISSKFNKSYDEKEIEFSAAEQSEITNFVESAKRMAEAFKKDAQPQAVKTSQPKTDREVNDPLNILRQILQKIEAVEKIKQSNPTTGSKSTKGKETGIITIIKKYNQSELLKDHEDLKFQDPETIPSKELVQSMITRAEEITEISSKSKPVDNEEENDDDSTTSNAEKKQHRIRQLVSNLKSEITLLKGALDQNYSTSIIEYCTTVIGQILRDLEDADPGIVKEITPRQFQDSKSRTKGIRSDLSHEILKKVELSDTLFRETLPMLPEVEALENILGNIYSQQPPLNAQSLLVVGKAYAKLLQYDKAMECFLKIQEIVKSSFTPDDFDSSQFLTAVADIINSITAIAETEGVMALDCLKRNNIEEYKRHLQNKIDNHLRCIFLIESFPGDHEKYTSHSLASNYNSLALALCYAQEYEKAVEYHKKAYKTIKKQIPAQPEAENKYLLNLAVTKFELLQSKDLAENPHDFFKNISFLSSAFFETMNYYRQNNQTKEDGYLRSLLYLTASLTLSHSFLDYLYAKEFFAELEGNIKKYPARKTSLEVRLYHDIAQKLAARTQLCEEFENKDKFTETSNKFKKNRALCDIEFQLQHLSYLMTFCIEEGIPIASLQQRLDQTNKDILQYQSHEITDDTKIVATVIAVNESAMADFHARNYRNALKGFNKALGALKSNPNFENYMHHAGTILNSIGDCYLDLNESQNALPAFLEALETYYDHLHKSPDKSEFRRAAVLPKKIFELHLKLATPDYIAKSMEMAKKALTKFTPIFIHENAIHLNEIQLVITYCLAMQGKYKEAYENHKTFPISDSQDNAALSKTLYAKLTSAEKLFFEAEEYHIPEINDEKLRIIKELSQQMGENEPQIRSKREQDWSLTYKVKLPSFLLEKGIRDKLGIERVKINKLSPQKEEQLKELVTQITIEKDGSEKILITFPKGQENRKLIEDFLEDKPVLDSNPLAHITPISGSLVSRSIYSHMTKS